MSNVEFDCPACLQEDSHFQSHATHVFQHLLDTAPSDSSLQADMKHHEEGFLAQVAIHSINGKFAAEGMGSDPMNALEAARGNTINLISEWKMNREAI